MTSLPSLPSDERRTPRWFFDVCNSLWGPFDVDCFAAKWNHQVERYFTKERSFYDWRGRARRGWVQPPYSRGQLYRALGHVRALVLARRLERATCLIPMDPSTRTWKEHVVRPEGLRLHAYWLELPKPFGHSAYQLVSDGLCVTVATPDVRLPFDCPPGTPVAELAKMSGAKQPSVVVTLERPRSGG